MPPVANTATRPEDDIEIEPPRPPAPGPFTAEITLYGLQRGKGSAWRKAALYESDAICIAAARGADGTAGNHIRCGKQAEWRLIEPLQRRVQNGRRRQIA